MSRTAPARIRTVRAKASIPSPVPDLATRLSRYDWPELAAALDAQGHGRLPGLLGAVECRELIRLYGDRARFRSFVEMARHRFGEGDYRYFARPLPALVQDLRTALYEPLSRIANAWSERLGAGLRYPTRYRDYERLCREAGQAQPTPLLLHYRAGGFNCLHQDLYGPLYFPLQVAVLLSEPDRDFTGGELLLVEQRPRMQSRGEAIVLAQGEGVVFPCRERPVRGTRGSFRATVRHGVSSVRSGERFTLGVIFHGAS